MKLAAFLPTPAKKLARRLIKFVVRDYSQAGETVDVRRLTRRKRGIFVEIGANDGLSLSTTYGLLQSGWQGWSIEANPATYQKLVENLRPFPRAKPINVAIAPSRERVKLFLGKNDPEGFYATLSTENSPWFDEHRSESFVEVEGVPLADFLENQGVPSRFDLLLIDSEGMDLEILQTLDPRKHRPFLIITEDYAPKNDAKFDLLRSFGYKYQNRVGCNTFWLDASTPRRAPDPS